MRTMEKNRSRRCDPRDNRHALASQPRAAWKIWMALLAMPNIFLAASPAAADGGLDDLARPQEGRSMRATSTMRIGEVRARRDHETESQGRPQGRSR